jgi:hypothetical protein
MANLYELLNRIGSHNIAQPAWIKESLRPLVEDLQEIAKKKTSSEIIKDSGCPAIGHNHRYFVGSVDAEIKMARRILKQLGVEIDGEL